MTAQYIVRDAPDSLGRPMIKSDVFGFIETRMETMDIESAEDFAVAIMHCIKESLHKKFTGGENEQTS